MQLVAVFLLPYVATGVSLFAETSIMRREATEVGSRGEMLLKSHAKKQRSDDTCDDVFVLGTEGQEECKDPTAFKRIDASMKELCVIAAGANAGPTFEISYVYYHVHPAGCFVDNGKYFFNPTFKAPNQTTVGTPVCVTTLFHNGTAGSATCPDEYVTMTSEDECRFAASCLSACAEGQFRDLNETEREKYPPGCHIRDDDHCYSFNNKTSVAPGTEIKGTPVCREKDAAPFVYEGADSDSSDSSDSSELVALSGRVADVEGARDASSDNPCSYLGCNGPKCEWASGGRVRRIVAAKSCSNAVVLGSAEISGNTTSSDGKPLVQIQTLKQCMHAVKERQDNACSGHFQMHKETWTCSCVPSGSTCAEQEDAKVCRYQVVD